jgi:hypothetical protein
VRHRLFTICSALSLLLFVAVSILWVRSYGLTDKLVWRRAEAERSIRSGKGHVLLALYLGDRSSRPADWFGLTYERGTPRPVIWDRNVTLLMNGEPGDTLAQYDAGGFAWFERRNVRRRTLTAHGTVPLWSIAAPAAALPLAWTTLRLRSRLRTRRRRRLGLCAGCGYDLRATPQACPECGRASSDACQSSNQDHSHMKRVPSAIAGFFIGFAAATAICVLVVLPILTQAERDEFHSRLNERSYYWWHAKSVATIATQLQRLTEHFAVYQTVNHDEPAATTRPTR